ncbi:vacuolar protein sorting/targeting protein 10 [Sistotremastrum suecicum HHB10207 ss-3]|uniref:Vacuolar protein sorting/targeting protein 10 n=1 Tax=Sistotremastrum suecicum HHB10207 ss-3 TaxID=1314776 RepID=A0A166DY63_9AGAM|nr:vacuolar protein sorting/targeting protein 10 [Sistotremastrum suecicum HHB10207 ss-3]
MRALSTLYTLLFSFFLSRSLKGVRADDPIVISNTFANLPGKLVYFDDTLNVVYHDSIEGTVHLSTDEGRTWKPVAGVPKGQAVLFVEHPFDNTYAFIVGPDKTHWRTKDRGLTWQSFQTPVMAAFVANPFSFHVDKDKVGYVLFQGTVCTNRIFDRVCHDETYYTKDAFTSEPTKLLSQTTKCLFAHSSKDFKHEAPSDLIYCLAFETTSSSGQHQLSGSRLYSTTDFFQNDVNLVDFGVGKQARGLVGLAIVSKFMVAALKDLSESANGQMLLYVSVDANNWAQALFPHASNSALRENAYTIVESTTHSLAVDVLLHSSSTIGTLFVSNSNGTFFRESLQNTNRDLMGFVDFEELIGVEGVGIANIVGNVQEVDGRQAEKQLISRITFDDGSSWTPIKAPSQDVNGQPIGCDTSNTESCSLHLYSVTTPHNLGRVFSSTAPGFVMGVGSVGPYIKPYQECDTFLSTDAGLTWKMFHADAHKYEFGDQGSILVIVNDEEATDVLRYSYDSGQTWHDLSLGVSVGARLLTTIPDSTSQKFLLLGTLARREQKGQGNHVMLYLDFAPIQKRECDHNPNSGDFEKWYARSGTGNQCVMGHKQYYWRRKANADCFVGHKFEDPVAIEENCPCTDEDFECDYNFVLSHGECIPAGPLPVGPGVCTGGQPGSKYLGSSGYRKIPGNTCEKGLDKEKPVYRDCASAQPPEGEVIHASFDFDSPIAQYEFFRDSHTLLVRLKDQTIWQSSNEGYTWTRLDLQGDKFLAFYIHSYTDHRAFLITPSQRVWFTTNAGQKWESFNAPSPPNGFGLAAIAFHPRQSNWLIWTGNVNCVTGVVGDCRAQAQVTTDNGRGWQLVENYVQTCQWARDKDLKVDEKQIICMSYKDKSGDQRNFGNSNPLQLVTGSPFYGKKTTLFNQVVGFAKFSEYLIVAEYQPADGSLDLQVSLDGRNFATGLFPPSMRPDNHAYTVLESSTDSVFLHLTTSDMRSVEFGNLLKSNSNGTYYGVSIENVNRNTAGFVDFEKMIGLDGIALINVVANPDSAKLSGTKELQTRITHNDGGTWATLNPPQKDSVGQTYKCTSTKCALHIHGYTERFDVRSTFSSPAIPGILMAVGNVGETLAPYPESDTFISRDAGFTWQEVHKDAHVWEFGDSGSILVMANDEVATDHVLYSTDEGTSWKEYNFGQNMRVKAIRNVPSDTSRKFVLFGYPARQNTKSIAVHLDFTQLTTKKCILNSNDPNNDDFELWSPAEARAEACLFGRKMQFHRRIRDRNCFIGDIQLKPTTIVNNCTCSAADFECEFNHVRDGSGNCVLVSDAKPLSIDTSATECRDPLADYWYERTAYRKIPYSSCEGGDRPDRGLRHDCPGLRGHSALFWIFITMIPFAFAGLAAWWYWKRSGLARGTIRLPDGRSATPGSGLTFPDSGPLATIASIPYFIIGVAGVAWNRISNALPRIPGINLTRGGLGAGRGYRSVAVDEDAQVLRFEDEE